MPRAFDRAYLAWIALTLLRDREGSYPVRVADGRMTQAEADASLAVSRAIVAQWRWAIDPALSPLPAEQEAGGHFGAAEPAMLAQLRTLATWARGHAAQAPDDRLRAHDADLYEALAWWQDSDGGCPRIVLHGLLDRRNPVVRWTPSPDDDAILRAFGFNQPQAKAA
jgi:hypothetical protein